MHLKIVHHLKISHNQKIIKRCYNNVGSLPSSIIYYYIISMNTTVTHNFTIQDISIVYEQQEVHRLDEKKTLDYR